MNNTNQQENNKATETTDNAAKRSSTIIEIKLGKSRRSFSGKLSARSPRSLFKSKSITKSTVTPTIKSVVIKSLLP